MESRRAFGLASKPMHYWTSEKSDKMKAFFKKFAQKMGFDPLIAENWYSVKQHVVKKFKVAFFILVVSKITYNIQGGGAVLSYFSGNIHKALTNIFPNIGLDVNKFSRRPSNSPFR